MGSKGLHDEYDNHTYGLVFGIFNILLGTKTVENYCREL